MVQCKDYQEICKEITKLEQGHKDGCIDYQTVSLLANLYAVKAAYEKEKEHENIVEKEKEYENIVEKEIKKEDEYKKFGYVSPVMPKVEHEDEEDIKGETDFIKIVNKHGKHKIIMCIDKYLTHARQWSPVEYNRFMDSIKNDARE